MILTAHQPVYLPWLGLFHKIALSNTFCYFDDVQYLKKDWNNRNKIKTPTGAIWLTVPVLTADHRKKPIREIEINNSVDWRRKHWKSVYINYKRTPYFERYASFLEDVYKKEWLYLSELNEYMLRWFLKELGIKITFCRASDYSFEGEKSALVADMCRQLGADIYIFGALGEDYAKEEDFSKINTKIYFQEYRHPVYPQQYGNFLPYMSALDLMFNCGERSLEILMSNNVTQEELRHIVQSVV